MKLFQIFLLSVIVNCFAQEKKTSEFRTSTFGGSVSTSRSGLWIPNKVQNTEIEGSSYLFDNWIGNYNVYDKDNNKFLVSNLNYNLLSNSLESKVSNDSVFQFDLVNINKIVFANKTYEVVDGKLLESFFAGKDFNFYKEYFIKINEATLNPMTQENLSNRKYIKKHNLMLVKNKVSNEFKINKKNILQLFKGREGEVKQFINKYNLSYNDENHFLKILNQFKI